MKTSEIFREALKFLWDGIEPKSRTKTKYVCHCLEKVNNKYTINVDLQLKIIEHLLKKNYTFDNWLRKEKGINTDLEDEQTNIKLQVTRKAWLEHLIKHYESIGD